eukprot:XP_003727655.1 PREDICTED: uncharacterized protein LOC100893517 [Strongylocentrotus purpuratus]
MAVRRDKHKTPVFLEKANKEQTRIQEKLHIKLKADIYRLFQDGTYSDTTLPCGPTPMHIHRAIFESRVPGLLDILCPDGVPNKTVLDLITAEDLAQFVKCVYQEDDLAKAWEMFLSHIAIPDEQRAGGEPVETSSAGDAELHPGGVKELEDVLLGAQGGAAASDVPIPKESSEVEEPCQRHNAVESVDPACRDQEEGPGEDGRTSNSLLHTEEADSANIPLTNGTEQLELPVDDHQGTEAASAATPGSQMDSVQQLDVCQYVTMDSPMGLVPMRLLQKEESAAVTFWDEASSPGPITDQNIPRVHSEQESGLDKCDEADAAIVNGIPALVLNGPTVQETNGTEHKQITNESLLNGDPTSSSQQENSDDQAVSLKKQESPVEDLNASNTNSDELHQFVARVHKLPAPSGTLAQNLMRLLDSDSSTFSDVALVPANDTRIPAHRFLLHCRCEIFAAMLGGGWIESETQEIQMKGLDFTMSRLVVETIIQFLYGGAASLSDDVNLRDLLGAADMYGLEGLKEVTAFHLKRDWCHLFHKPLCAECSALVPHCYALSESFGLPDLSQMCLRWMSKNMDRFWVQKTFSNLPPEMHEKCSKDVMEILNGKNAIEVLFQLDKIKLSLPLGQSSWAEPAKEITSKTWKQVLQFAANYFHNILDGPMFEDKYLKGMGWKKDVMEPLFRKVVAGLSLGNADLNFRAVWRLYKRERTDKEKEEGKTPEEEWNPDAYTAFGGFYDKIYNYVVSNASYIVNTEIFKQLPEDLQKQIRKDAVYVDTGMSKTLKKPVLSSSQRPKSAQVRRTLSHPIRASSPASSTSSASSVSSAPSSSRRGGVGTGSARGAGGSSRGVGGAGRGVGGSSRGAGSSTRGTVGSERGVGGADRGAEGSLRGVGGPARGAGGPSRGTGSSTRGAGSGSARATGRGGAAGRGADGSARGNGTGRSRGEEAGAAGVGGAQRPTRPRDGRHPPGR